MLVTLNLKQIVQRRLVQQAIPRAYAKFAQGYPEWAATHFDPYFLTHRQALLLTRAGQGLTTSTAFALAHAWSRQTTWYNEAKRPQWGPTLKPVILFLPGFVV